jgi:hypothetical protein
VVTQKDALPLAWRPPSLHHVLGDARLCDLKPELQKFALDASLRPRKSDLRSRSSVISPT